MQVTAPAVCFDTPSALAVGVSTDNPPVVPALNPAKNQAIIPLVKYTIVFTREALEDLKAFNARQKRILLDGIERHLRDEPEKVSRSRIKRLNDVEWPQYRLRIDKNRIFYDVESDIVTIIAIMPKKECEEWLKKHGRTIKED